MKTKIFVLLAALALFAVTLVSQTRRTPGTQGSPVTRPVTANVLSLTTNPTNCSAGQYSRGIDASGNAEDCTSAAAAGIVLLDTQTASDSASLTTTCFSATYNRYLLDLENLVPATDNVSLLARTGAGSIDTGANYRYAGFYNGVGDSVTGISGAAQSSVILGNSIKTTANWGVDGEVVIQHPLSTALFKKFRSEITSSSGGSSTLYLWRSSGVWLSASAADRFQVFFSSGNITSGVMRCYGIAK